MQSPRASPAVGTEFVYCFGYQAILSIRAPDVSPVCSLLRWHFNIHALRFQRAVSFTDRIKSWANKRETPSKLQNTKSKSTVSNLCFYPSDLSWMRALPFAADSIWEQDLLFCLSGLLCFFFNLFEKLLPGESSQCCSSIFYYSV